MRSRFRRFRKEICTLCMIGPPRSGGQPLVADLSDLVMSEPQLRAFPLKNARTHQFRHGARQAILAHPCHRAQYIYFQDTPDHGGQVDDFARVGRKKTETMLDRRPHTVRDDRHQVLRGKWSWRRALRAWPASDLA